MYILFDIGGTKMRVAGSRDCREFVDEPKVEKTPKNFKEGITLLKEMAYSICGKEKIEMVGGGIAGPFQVKTGSMIASPNLPDWVNKPLADELEKALDASVHVENDSAVVGLGEMHFGAGITDGIGVYLTVSTGVGGARFIDGEIDKKAVAFEFGHQIIDAGKALCSNCESPYLAQLISGKSTEMRLGTAPYEVPQNDPMWDQYAQFLAYGLNNIVMLTSPDVIVVGGSMMVGDPVIPIENTRKYLKKLVEEKHPIVPEVRLAKLKDFGGLYGAMVLIEKHC